MSFNDIKGQEFAVNYLKNIILKKRIPPTLMFVGKNGTGRRKTAVTFAKALNCKYIEGDSCDKCESCLAVEKGIHPNVKLIGAGGRIGIDDVRSITNDSFTPVNSGYRVNILDNADSSSIQAFNSMLKYLEEPPDGTVNILLVNDIYNIPETIRSRSVIIKFHPLSNKVIENFLVLHGVDEEKALVVSHLLNGSLENWEEYVNDDFLTKRQAFMEELLLFFRRRSDSFSLIEKWKELFPNLSPRESAERFLDYVSILVQDILHVSVLSEKDNITNIDFLGYIANKFSAINEKSLEKIFDIVKEHKNALLTNANPKYIMVDGILKMKEVIL